MKKVKIMFTAITVFAVVGGALAFKAKTPTGLYCSDSRASGSAIVCPTFTTQYKLTDQNPLANTFCGTTITSCDKDVTFE